jgi:hypothetical protein
MADSNSPHPFQKKPKKILVDVQMTIFLFKILTFDNCTLRKTFLRKTLMHRYQGANRIRGD